MELLSDDSQGGGAGAHAPAQGADELTVTARTFEALAHPVRLAVVRQLAREGELSCSQIEAPLASSSMSRHYRLLREAGLVDVRQEGTYRYLRLRADHLETRFPGLVNLVTGSAAHPLSDRKLVPE